LKKPTRFRSIKSELRIVGIDDGKLLHPTSKCVPLVGVVFRGGRWLDGLLKIAIQTDGLDATDKIARMIKGSSHYSQIRVLMPYGLTFAGLNIINIRRLYEKVERPVIVVTRSKPNLTAIEERVKRLPDGEARLQFLKEAGDPVPVVTREGSAPIYLQAYGLAVEDAKKIAVTSSTRDSLPEPVRVANIIASALRPQAA